MLHCAFDITYNAASVPLVWVPPGQSHFMFILIAKSVCRSIIREYSSSDLTQASVLVYDFRDYAFSDFTHYECPSLCFLCIDIVDLQGVSSQAKRIASLWLDHVLVLMQLRCHSCGLHQGIRIMHPSLQNPDVAHANFYNKNSNLNYDMKSQCS